MPPSRLARATFLATAAVAVVAILIQLVLAYRDAGGQFATPVGRAANILTYFTILSNGLVAAVSVAAARSVEPPPPTFPWAVARLTGLIAIVVTGAVYHLVLAGESDNDALGEFATQALHTVVPLLAILGWIAFGPRGAIASGTAWRSLLFPLGWLAFTLIRGAIDGYYPYPFIDVDDLGYGRVAINCLILAGVFVGLAFGALGLDRALARLRR